MNKASVGGPPGVGAGYRVWPAEYWGRGENHYHWDHDRLEIEDLPGCIMMEGQTVAQLGFVTVGAAWPAPAPTVHTHTHQVGMDMVDRYDRYHTHTSRHTLGLRIWYHFVCIIKYTCIQIYLSSRRRLRRQCWWWTVQAGTMMQIICKWLQMHSRTLEHVK